MDELLEYRVNGASDDVIEVQGPNLSAEHSPAWQAKDPTIVAFSDGTVLSVQYDGPRGVWRITPLSKGSASLALNLAAADDADECSDIATLRSEDPITWVVFGVAYEMSRRQ